MDSYVSAINALGMTAILNPYESNVGATDLVKAGNAPQFPNKSPRAPVRDRFCGR